MAGDGEDGVVAAQAHKSKGHRTPDTYDGKAPEDFPQWLAKFEMIAKANKWGEGDDLNNTLPIYLKDHAFNLYLTLSETETDNYDHTVAALSKGLGIGENSLAWRLELRQAKRLPSEGVDIYAFRLAKLAVQAFPGEDPASRERNVAEQFILGQKSDVTKYLLQDKPGTLAELKERTKRYEAAQALADGPRNIHMVEAEDSLKANPGDGPVNPEVPEWGGKALADAISLIANLTSNEGSPGMRKSASPAAFQRRCYKCNETGHLAAGCRGTTPSGCFQCGQDGHFKRDCPQRAPARAPQGQFQQRAPVRRAFCLRCGNTGHQATECRTDINKLCTFCQKKGHLSAECRGRRTSTEAAGVMATGGPSVTKNDHTQAENGPSWD